MYQAYRFSFRASLWWTRHTLAVVTAYSTAVCSLAYFTGWKWFALPWQPVGLLGVALAFYLGFKNNSAYSRLWEARKIWGGIVNASRSFAVMARDFVHSEERGQQLRRELVHRHVAWLHMLTVELRKVAPWEHQGKLSTGDRQRFGTAVTEADAKAILRQYVAADEGEYVLTKGNRSSHLLSVQSRRMMELRNAGIIDHFRHLAMQALITEFYTLQGKAERIKKFPLPRQWASANAYCIFIFLVLLPFGMIDVFSRGSGAESVYLAMPASVVCFWVFWLMDRVGEYSENPFEGLANDVPIRNMARGIEIDIRQMLDETELPPPIGPVEGTDVLV
ncbi:MAG: multidrug transporter [Myxococcales bacterium FL481]|nr:MAG: multidrug transporter [Myxococcales bacterium FL481]